VTVKWARWVVVVVVAAAAAAVVVGGGLSHVAKGHSAGKGAPISTAPVRVVRWPVEVPGTVSLLRRFLVAVNHHLQWVAQVTVEVGKG
jgi:hypothetical protein